MLLFNLAASSTSPTVSYTATKECKVMLVVGSNSTSSTLTVNGVSLNSGTGAAYQMIIYLSAGQTLTVATTTTTTCIGSVLEEY